MLSLLDLRSPSLAGQPLISVLKMKTYLGHQREEVEVKVLHCQIDGAAPLLADPP